MRLTRYMRNQLIIFLIVGTVAIVTIAFGYMKLPSLLGIGRYTVTLELPKAAGLYETGNVTYRGTEVGRVVGVDLTRDGVAAKLSLDSSISIPTDLDAQVHSQSAIGEQYVALVPRSGEGPKLRNGDVIPRSRASVPPDINTLLDSTVKGLKAIPHDDLKTLIDESATAFGGLGPELSRLVRGSTTLAIDSRANLDAMTALIDQSGAILDSQADSAGAIRGWADHLATVTSQLRDHNDAVSGIIEKAGPSSDEMQKLLDRFQPTIPVIMSNMASIGEVALAYHAALEQILVLIPQGTAIFQGVALPNRHVDSPFKGNYLDFNLNGNVPPPCMTGFLPPQQQRPPSLVDAPERPSGDLYCRIPQDSQMNVRGARNIPCATVPGKRAPTVKMCESVENYVPLNDGMSWKGDPNATLSGQDIPQSAPTGPTIPGAVPPTGAPPVIGATNYDPATGSYVGPDGKVYQRADLAQGQPDPDWQSMVLPAGN